MNTTGPDAALIKRFQGGDARAFAVIYKHYFKGLRYFAKLIVGHDWEAEDIAAETLIKLWKLRENFEEPSKVKSFLYISTRNACINHIKYDKKIQISRENYAKWMQQPEGFNLQMIEAGVLQYINNEIESLPQQCKAIFKMAFFEEKDNAAIAKELNLSVQTVKNQKVKAIKSLQASVIKGKIDPLK